VAGEVVGPDAAVAGAGGVRAVAVDADGVPDGATMAVMKPMSSAPAWPGTPQQGI
jgi:hypothetical protein